MQKIEEFLFDILGLTLPGMIFCFSLCSLIFLNIPIGEYKVVLIKLLEFVSEYSLLEIPSAVLYSLIILFCYIIGHFIKVVGKYFYVFGPFVFDKVLLKPIVWSKNKMNILLEKINKMKGIIYKLIGFNIEILVKILTITEELFSFSTVSYNSEFNEMREESIRLLNEKHSISIHNDYSKWYPYYKSALTIAEQNKVKTHARIFLAKYNFYRSLAFVFLIHSIFIILLKFYFDICINLIWKVLFVVDILFWITFHTKYKRYWMACGNEAIVGLYHSLVLMNDNQSEDY